MTNRHGFRRLAFATARRYRHLSQDDRLALAELQARGFRVDAVVWDDEAVDWRAYDAVVVRSCWDYHLAPARFRAWVDLLDEAGVTLWNPPALLRWNADKHYLLDLERAGIPVVPTAWLRRADAEQLPEFLGGLAWPEVVMKPAVSASAFRTVRVRCDGRDGALAAARHILEHGDLLVQPFLETVVSEGEWALMFFDGVYSHAVLKQPAEGDFRVQQEWGGRDAPATPAAVMLDAAQRAVGLAGASLYARVDGVAHQGAFLVMELELIEPFLFFSSAVAATRRFADAIERGLVVAAEHRSEKSRKSRMSGGHRDPEGIMADQPKPGGAWDATQWYEVKKGDTLSKIAEQFYGDPKLYPKIFEANRDVLKDPNLIQIGQKLRIP